MSMSIQIADYDDYKNIVAGEKKRKQELEDLGDDPQYTDQEQDDLRVPDPVPHIGTWGDLGTTRQF